LKIEFIGTGEACDEHCPNTSLLVRTGGGKRATLLLDCGFTASTRFWLHAKDPDELDGIWISHFHGDHFFGMPLLLLRFWEMKRRKPLTVLSQQGGKGPVLDAMELAYPGFLRKMRYELEFVEVEPERPVQALGLQWRAAPTRHSRRNLAVRLDDGDASLFYSGDGAPTAETSKLARNIDLVVHEAFGLEPLVEGHGTVQGCVAFAREVRAARLALVHVQRDVRRERKGEILEMARGTEDVPVFLPEPGDAVEI